MSGREAIEVVRRMSSIERRAAMETGSDSTLRQVASWPSTSPAGWYALLDEVGAIDLGQEVAASDVGLLLGRPVLSGKLNHGRVTPGRVKSCPTCAVRFQPVHGRTVYCPACQRKRGLPVRVAA